MAPGRDCRTQYDELCTLVVEPSSCEARLRITISGFPAILQLGTDMLPYRGSLILCRVFNLVRQELPFK